DDRGGVVAGPRPGRRNAERARAVRPRRSRAAARAGGEPMMRRRAWCALVAAAGIMLSSCGGGGGPAMTAGAARELADRAAAVRAAVGSEDRAVADAALVSMRESVATLRQRHELSADKAGSILAAV